MERRVRDARALSDGLCEKKTYSCRATPVIAKHYGSSCYDDIFTQWAHRLRNISNVAANILGTIIMLFNVNVNNVTKMF